jgi:hypothetical protein
MRSRLGETRHFGLDARRPEFACGVKEVTGGPSEAYYLNDYAPGLEVNQAHDETSSTRI